MSNSKLIVLISVVVSLTFINVLLWTKTRYVPGYGTPITYKNQDKTEELLANIRKELEYDLEKLRFMNNFNESTEQLFKNMKNFSTIQVPLRKRTLGQVSKASHYPLVYGALAPEVFCPEKVRIGTVGDGGKWVCNPWKVPNDSVLFSLGLNNLITFEMDWQKLLSNRSLLYGFDKDDQSKKTAKEYASIRGTAKKATISLKTDRSDDEYTINDLAKFYNISQIEILKIDIEGAELTCLVPFLTEFKVCQIYLEVHGGADEHLELLQQVAHLDYRLFSYEVNGYSMSACEYSFIHESCVDKYGGRRIANYLDFTS